MQLFHDDSKTTKDINLKHQNIEFQLSAKMPVLFDKCLPAEVGGGAVGVTGLQGTGIMAWTVKFRVKFPCRVQV